MAAGIRTDAIPATGRRSAAATGEKRDHGGFGSVQDTVADRAPAS